MHTFTENLFSIKYARRSNNVISGIDFTLLYVQWEILCIFLGHPGANDAKIEGV